MKKLKEYIEENRDKIYKIESFVNDKDIPDIDDENTRFLCTYNMEKNTECEIQETEKLHPHLYEIEPLKVYLMDAFLYDQRFYPDLSSGTPDDKSNLIVLYGKNAIIKGEIE